MTIKKGKRRVVVVLSSVAIKFPRFHLKTVFRLLRAYLKYGSQYIEEYWGDTPGHALKWWLFVGIKDNWREFVFYHKTHHPFLRPTYFSLLGLLNVQQLGSPIMLGESDFANQMLDLLGSSGLWIDDIHHFTKPENFCDESGRLQILDYGSDLTQRIISEVGTKIHSGFQL